MHVGHDASDAGGGRPFRPPDPLLEPEDGAVHLRPPQQDPHHQPREDPGDVPGGAQVRAPARRQQGQRSCSSAPSARRARSSREEAQRCRRAVRRLPLAGRHAHQLQDRQAVDQAPEGDGAMVAGRHARAPVEEGSARHPARDGEARALAGRHQGHGRPARRAVRDRRGLPEGRGRRGEQARHPGGRRGRHQPLARRHRLRDPGQRRLEPRDPPVRARHGRRGARGPQPGRSRRWSPPSRDEFVEVEEEDEGEQ